VDRRPHAERDADDGADDERHHRQLDRPRQDLEDLLDHRAAADHRCTPVAAHRVADEVDILHPERPVEAEPLAQRAQRRLVGQVAEDHLRGVAGQDAYDHEDKGEDGEAGQDRQNRAAEEKGGHGPLCRERRRRHGERGFVPAPQRATS
jgi:hypothetical protein